MVTNELATVVVLEGVVFKHPDTFPREEIELFLRNHPEQNFFQSLEILDFFSNVHGHNPICICIWADNVLSGLLCGVQVKKQSNRVYFDNGPLFSENVDSVDVLREMLLIIDEEFSGSRIQFRRLLKLIDLDSEFSECNYQVLNRYNILLDLKNEALLSDFSNSKKRQIRHCYDNGLQINPVCDIQELEAFYVILENLYKTKIQKPLPPFDFLIKFYNLIQLNKKGIVLIARFRGEVVGGIVCPFSANRIIHEWYIAGNDKECCCDNVHPSVYLTYAAIKYGIDNGFSTFDFMGAGMPGVHYGVRDFKLQFGGELSSTQRFIKEN